MNADCFFLGGGGELEGNWCEWGDMGSMTAAAAHLQFDECRRRRHPRNLHAPTQTPQHDGPTTAGVRRLGVPARCNALCSQQSSHRLASPRPAAGGGRPEGGHPPQRHFMKSHGQRLMPRDQNPVHSVCPSVHCSSSSCCGLYMWYVSVVCPSPTVLCTCAGMCAVLSLVLPQRLGHVCACVCVASWGVCASWARVVCAFLSALLVPPERWTAPESMRPARPNPA